MKEASSEIEKANSKIEEALDFSKAGLAQKPRANLLFQICPHLSHATSALDGAQNSKRQAQKLERHLLFQTCHHLSHAHSALQKSRAVYRSADSRYRRGTCFSRRVSACHIHTQFCKNHGQFVKAPIPDIEEAFAFPDVSAPVTCTFSLAEITGNLSKISCEVEGT
ncbi:hypothetical protein ACFX2C_030125 [Malus domestica]